jgi:hypothetical protein
MPQHRGPSGETSYSGGETRAGMRGLIYISGSGRSGSTLLERILHSSPDMVGLGEFHCLWRLAEEDIHCACARGFPEDDFWSECLKDAAVGHIELAELRALENEVARFGTVRAARYDLDSLRADARIRRFLAPQFAVFEAAAALSGAAFVVDSSKAGPRAWLLATDPRVHIVHLYREPADVIASWRSRKFDPGLRGDMKRPSIRAAASEWMKAEFLARRLAQVRPVQMIDYARLCRDPEQVVDEILDALPVPRIARPAWSGPARFGPRSPYHSLNGNPDRFQLGPVNIRFRAPDHRRLNSIDRLLTPLAGAGLKAIYSPPTFSSRRDSRTGDTGSS